MVKTINKIGNSKGLIFDTALTELTGLDVGDQINITVTDGGSIVLTPIRKAVSHEVVSRVVRQTVSDYGKTLKKLA
jgi:antitoxin component of MazEF toxin-antitoxin module